jgi:hypothetical protein
MKYLVIFFSLIVTLTVKAEIIITDNFATIRDKFFDVQSNYDPLYTLGVFEIRDVILRPYNQELTEINIHQRPLVEKILSQLKPSNNIYFNEVLLVNYKQELVDKDLPQFIKEIASHNSPLIAITETLTGNFNKIDRFEVWLADYLKKFNIDFSASFPKSNDLIFSNREPFQGTYPTFYHGILSCNNNEKLNSKLQMLIAFLQQLKFTPQVIIMVSKDIALLTGTEEQLKSFDNNITFIGYHFLPAMQAEQVQINDQDLTKFWSSLVAKINKVSRTNKNPNQKTNPYE